MDERRNFAILPHLGLGDALALKGLARWVASLGDEVVWIGLRKYQKSLQSIFADIDNVQILLVDSDADVSPVFGSDGRLWQRLEREGYAVLPLGQHAASDWLGLDSLWTRCLYKQLGVPPSAMYSHFGTLGRDDARNREVAGIAARHLGERYVVVHDDPARDMAIDASWLPADLPRIHVDDPRIRSNDITDYLDLIAAAAEMHCIESCFALMADLHFEPGAGPRRVVHETPGRPCVPPGLYRGTEVARHGIATPPANASASASAVGPDGRRISL